MSINIATPRGRAQLMEDYRLRLVWWHEAGHAVAALHHNRKIHSVGMEPIPVLEGPLSEKADVAVV